MLCIKVLRPNLTIFKCLLKVYLCEKYVFNFYCANIYYYFNIMFEIPVEVIYLSILTVGK